MVAADVAQHLNSKDPEIRGEAAIVVAAAGHVAQELRLLEIANDPSPAASYRATLALGLLATPQAITYLEELLRTTAGRTSDQGVVAAFALGLVPTDRIETAVARTLTLFEHGSWKRQHDIFISLLIGMTRQPGRSEQRALAQLLENDANRAAESRALLLQLLLPITQIQDGHKLRRTLRRGSELERLAIVNWISSRTPTDNKPWLDDLIRIAKRGESPELRAAALLTLARSRHLPALEIAAQALNSSSLLECRQAIAAMMAIGGASTHGALEKHLLNERKPQRMQALLEGFLAPPSQELVEHAVSIATNTKLPVATRAAAAALIARSHKTRAAPILRDLFRIAKTPDVLTSLARTLRRVETSPTELGRLLDKPIALTQHPLRWQALLAAGHGEAQRQVLLVLQDRNSSDDDVRTTIKAWRRTMVLKSAGTLAPQRLANYLN